MVGHGRTRVAREGEAGFVAVERIRVAGYARELQDPARVARALREEMEHVAAQIVTRPRREEPRMCLGSVMAAGSHDRGRCGVVGGYGGDVSDRGEHPRGERAESSGRKTC